MNILTIGGHFKFYATSMIFSGSRFPLDYVWGDGFLHQLIPSFMYTDILKFYHLN